MQITPFIRDILSQPEVLKRAIPAYDYSGLAPLAEQIKDKRINRIFITGMGGSLAAAYAAWLILARQGFPVFLVDCAEMLHNTFAQVTADSLVWMISQSGRSAELVKLVEVVKDRKASLIVTTNDLASPVAAAAKVSMSIQSPEELTVSTVTFTTTLASIQLAAHQLCGISLAQVREDLLWTVDECAKYLADWELHVRRMEEMVGIPKHLVVVGRGLSLPAVHCGSLVQIEAAKMPTLAMNAGEFRHGPLEICSPELTIVVLAGEVHTRELNRRLCSEFLTYDTHALWMDSSPQAELPAIEMPAWRGAGLPIAEILPFQLMSVAISNGKGIEAGKFYRSGKITLTE